MDINHDEVRRQLRESADEHDEAMPRFREALRRLFDPRSKATDDDKAALLGVPSRRSLLTLGGAAVAGSALVACTSPAKKQLAETGDTPVPVSSTTVAPGSADMDLTLLRTAQSFEVLLVKTYDAAVSGGSLTTPSVLDAAKLFGSQHQQHADLLSSTITGLGGTPFDKPNDYMQIAVTTPGLAAITDEASAAKFFAELENTAAQTYTQSGQVLTSAALRGTAMSIAATEARHLTVWYGVQQLNPTPLPFFPTRDAIVPDAYIDPKATGPRKTPEPPTTTTTAAA